MTTKNIKNQGFTLVELLIVIVIIAILTVVSLVAYNGLQNQAKTSAAKSAADAVAKKAELYNTAESNYPGGLGDLTNPANSSKPYYLDVKTVKTPGSAFPAVGTAINPAPAEANTVEYAPCTGASGNTGAHVRYYNFSESKVEERTIGTGC